MTIIYTCTDKLGILTLRVSYHLKPKLKIRFVETNWPSNKEKTQLQQRTKFIWNNFARLEFIYWRFFDPNQGDNNLFCLPPTHNLEGTLFMQNRKIERRHVTGQLCTVQPSKEALIGLRLARSKILEWTRRKAPSYDTMWSEELPQERQLLSTQQIISKYYWKKPFLSKHLLVIFCKKDCEKVYIDITWLAKVWLKNVPWNKLI